MTRSLEQCLPGLENGWVSSYPLAALCFLSWVDCHSDLLPSDLPNYPALTDWDEKAERNSLPPTLPEALAGRPVSQVWKFRAYHNVPDKCGQLKVKREYVESFWGHKVRNLAGI